MNIFLNAFFAILSFSLIMIAGWLPLKKLNGKPHEHKHIMPADALATGIFLGMAFMHMLPEANLHFTEQNFQYPVAFFIMSITFLIFLWLEHWASELYQHQHAITFTILAWSMLSIHSLFMGMALGLAQSNSIAWMLFFAIILHKWAESFSLAQQIQRLKISHIKRYMLFTLYALFTPIGIASGMHYQHAAQNIGMIEPIILAFSSGIFLYLGTLHGLDRCIMLKACCNLRDYSLVILGFSIMAVTT